MLASQEGHVEVVRLLEASGADKSLTNRDGATALMLASQMGHAEVVPLLAAANADKSTRTNGVTVSLMASPRRRAEGRSLLMMQAGGRVKEIGECGRVRIAKHVAHKEREVAACKYETIPNFDPDRDITLESCCWCAGF